MHNEVLKGINEGIQNIVIYLDNSHMYELKIYIICRIYFLNHNTNCYMIF